MNLDQKVTIIFSTLGFGCGFLSIQFSSLNFSASLPLILYLIGFIILKRKIKSKTKKTRSILLNSFMSFILVWGVVWIFLFNIGW